jgi:hypothetical protein
LTLDNNTEPVETPDQPDAEDSGVIKGLRADVKDLKAQVKAAPSREVLEAEIRSELARESAIKEQLVSLGHPAGIMELVSGKLGEAEVTKESVAEALTGIGYEVDVDGAGSGDDANTGDPSSDLAKVTSLSAQVQSAAQNVPADDVGQKIAEAETPAQLAEIMAKADLLQK